MLRNIPKPDLAQPASDASVCPLCHTALSTASDPMSSECGRCGQKWSARRLATVASYASWVDARAHTTETRNPVGSAVAVTEAPHARIHP